MLPQRFLLIHLKPKHVFRRGAHGAVFCDTPYYIIRNMLRESIGLPRII